MNSFIESDKSAYDWLNTFSIKEAKQVGTIYHFTIRSSRLFINGGETILRDILKQGLNTGTGARDYVSFTRNPTLIDSIMEVDSWGVVRFVIDGDKLSNKYSIEPYLDVEWDVKRDSGEREERVIIGKDKYMQIIPFITSIDILDTKIDQFIYRSIADTIKRNIEEKYNIPVRLVSIQPIKR